MRAPRAGRWGQERKEPGGGRERVWEGGGGQAGHVPPTTNPLLGTCACREGTARPHRPHNERLLPGPPHQAEARGAIALRVWGARQVGGPAPGLAWPGPALPSPALLMAVFFQCASGPPSPRWPPWPPTLGLWCAGTGRGLQPACPGLQEQSRSRNSAHPS